MSGQWSVVRDQGSGDANAAISRKGAKTQRRKARGKVIEEMQQDVQYLRALIQKKSPDKLVIKKEPIIPDSLPELDSLNTDEEIAGAYIFILERIQTERVQELDQAQRSFVMKINENLSLNIDVADIEQQLSKVWIREWAYSIGVLVGEALGAYLILRRGVPYAIKKSPAAVRGAVRGARGVGRGISRVVKVGKEGARKAASLARRPIRAPSRLKLPKGTGRALGIAGTVYLAWETKEAIELALSIENLSERYGVDSALEFMETHPNVDRNADRYTGEVVSLRMRQQLISMREVTKHELEKLNSMKVSPEHREELKRLQKEAKEISSDAQLHNRELYDYFPITKHLKKSSKDPSDVVRVIYSRLINARGEGVDAALPMSASKWLSERVGFRGKSKKTPDEQTDDVLKEMEERDRIQQKVSQFTSEIYEGLPEKMWKGQIGMYKDDFERTLSRYDDFLQEVSSLYERLKSG